MDGGKEGGKEGEREEEERGKERKSEGEGKQTQTLVVGERKVTCKITFPQFLE